MKPYRYLVPTEIVFGPGSLDALPERCRTLGQRPLLVTGRHSARAAGLLDRVMQMLPEAVLFDEVEENPAVAICAKGAHLARETGCDHVVGLGGGSAMDAAKAIAVLATNPGPGSAYFGVDLFPAAPLPIAAVPTTAGTGSEVTPYAVLLDTETHSKRTISGRALFPACALLDPALSVSMPRAVTAATGLDALSQAMEGMSSRKSTPVGDALALEACRLIRQWLPRAVSEPENLDARGAMLHAAMLSGCIIAQSGTTLVHGMGYYFTLEYGIAHGLANALLLAPVFQHNARCEPARVAALAAALGHDTGDPVRDIGEAIHTILRAAGMPVAAREAGVKAEHLRAFAEDIHRDPYRFKNQVGEFSVEDVHRLFESACEGRLESA
jgi:alcohol dehydrogenase class IV